MSGYDLSGRVALVTGGGRGIGREICRVLARAGADIVVAELDPATGADAAAEIAALGRRAIAVEVDVRELPSVEAMLARALGTFDAIDILVNNAAVGPPNLPFLEQDPELWRRTVDIDINGVAWPCRVVGAHMVARGRGSVVNIGSMSGHIVNRPQPQADYNAAKAAVIHLTKSLATEWGRSGVRVNSVSPGYIGTEMTKRGMAERGWGEEWVSHTPIGRVGEPVEVANVVWFLASDLASFCTGTDVIVDGGYTCW